MQSIRISSGSAASSSNFSRPALRCQLGRGMVVGVTRQGRGACAASSSDNYAVIEMDGYQQWVEEGAVLACNKHVLNEIALGNTVQFKKVIALKYGDNLNMGKPYLTDVTVEGRLEDEFRGPSSSSDSEDDIASLAGQLDSSNFNKELMLRRVLITKISPAGVAPESA